MWQINPLVTQMHIILASRYFTFQLSIYCTSSSFSLWFCRYFVDIRLAEHVTYSSFLSGTVRQFIQSQSRHPHGYGLSDDDDETAPLIQSNKVRRYTPPASSFYTVAASDRLSYHTVLGKWNTQVPVVM